MNLKVYIEEAISSGKHSGIYTDNGIVTDKTSFSDTLDIVESRGLRWYANMNFDERIDDKFIKSVLDTWKDSYDYLKLHNGLTCLVVKAGKFCFILYWDTNSRERSGPVGGSYYQKSGALRRSGDLDDTLNALNVALL